jgi:hypothetical protein
LPDSEADELKKPGFSEKPGFWSGTLLLDAAKEGYQSDFFLSSAYLPARRV